MAPRRRLGKKVAVGYCRVSTAGQATDGVSLDAQRERIEQWCQQHGYELADVFVDAGKSGKRADNRPELQRALKNTCDANAALVVYSLSRLARSVQDTLAIADRLGKANADLVSLSESIDTTTAAGKMVFRMLAVLAEFERDLVSERTTAALAHKRANGEKTGGRLPFGFRLADDGRTLVADPLEQAVIERIISLRRKGRTYDSIAETLNAAATTSKSGGLWSAKVVRGVYLRATA